MTGLWLPTCRYHRLVQEEPREWRGRHVRFSVFRLISTPEINAFLPPTLLGHPNSRQRCFSCTVSLLMCLRHISCYLELGYPDIESLTDLAPRCVADRTEIIKGVVNSPACKETNGKPAEFKAEVCKVLVMTQSGPESQIPSQIWHPIFRLENRNRCSLRTGRYGLRRPHPRAVSGQLTGREGATRGAEALRCIYLLWGRDICKPPWIPRPFCVH